MTARLLDGSDGPLGRRAPSAVGAAGAVHAAGSVGGGVGGWWAVDEPVASPAAFRRRRWHIIGSDRHPAAAGLLARSAGMRPALGPEPPYPAATAVLLGDRFGWRDNAMLLDGVAAARRDGGRLVLVHTGAGGASLLRVAAKELARLEVMAIELPADPAPRAVRVAIALACDDRVAGTDLLVHADGLVTRQRWQPVDLPAPPVPLPATSTARCVLVTGGLGGLGIRVAAVLSAVYRLHPVLLDATTPAELSPDAAGYLARLRRGGTGVTVRTTDVTDADGVAAALSTVDTAPIVGVVHCAGLLQGRPLDRFTSHDLAVAQLVKVDGLRNVLAAVDRRRLRHLITFGSITAETPHRSMASYALANELLRRETLRAARELPVAATVAAQWSLWSGAGMAHQAGAVSQARRMGMIPVSLRAGTSALLRLLSWPAGPEHAAALILQGQRA